MGTFIFYHVVPCLPPTARILPSRSPSLTIPPASSSAPLSLAPSSPSSLSLQGRNQYAAGVVAQRPIFQSFRVFANSAMSSRKRSPDDKVIMVDPLEAKRLAAKQMEELRAKEKFKRLRQIETINGAWAIIGLTAGLVIEGQTGNGIGAQLAGYWSAVTIFLRKLIPL